MNTSAPQISADSGQRTSSAIRTPMRIALLLFGLVEVVAMYLLFATAGRHWIGRTGTAHA